MAQEKGLAADAGLPGCSGYEPKVTRGAAMSLSTMRRRNSRPREGDTQHGAPQREDQARGPPPRRGEERLEVGAADRRLDALIEEERGRAVSLPAGPGVKRLEVAGGRSQSSQQGPMMGQLQGPVTGPQTVPDALSDPRAEAMGLGALQDAVRHSFGLLQQALGRPVPQQGLLGPLLGGDDSGARQGVVPNTGGGPLLFASPGAVQGSRGAEGERSGHLDGCVASGSGRNDGLKTPGSGQPDRHGVEPRVLDPYGTPAQGASQGVILFGVMGCSVQFTAKVITLQPAATMVCRASMQRSRSSKRSACVKPKKLLQGRSRSLEWPRRPRRSPIILLPVHRACRRCQMEVEVLLQMVELEVHLKAQNLHQDWLQFGLVLMGRWVQLFQNLFVTLNFLLCLWWDRMVLPSNLEIGWRWHSPWCLTWAFQRRDGGRDQWQLQRISMEDGWNLLRWSAWGWSRRWRWTQGTWGWNSGGLRCCWASFLKLFDATLWELATCPRLPSSTGSLWFSSRVVVQKGHHFWSPWRRSELAQRFMTCLGRFAFGGGGCPELWSWRWRSRTPWFWCRSLDGCRTLWGNKEVRRWPTDWRRFARSFKLIKDLYSMLFRSMQSSCRRRQRIWVWCWLGQNLHPRRCHQRALRQELLLQLRWRQLLWVEVVRMKRGSQHASFGVPLVAADVVSHARTLTAGTTSTRMDDAMDVQLKGIWRKIAPIGRRMEVLKGHQRSQRSRAVPKRRIHLRRPKTTWWLGTALKLRHCRALCPWRRLHHQRRRRGARVQGVRALTLLPRWLTRRQCCWRPFDQWSRWRSSRSTTGHVRIINWSHFWMEGRLMACGQLRFGKGRIWNLCRWSLLRGQHGCIATEATARCSVWRMWSRLCRFTDWWRWASRLNGRRRVAGSSTLPEEWSLVLLEVDALSWTEAMLFCCWRKWRRLMDLRWMWMWMSTSGGRRISRRCLIASSGSWWAPWNLGTLLHCPGIGISAEHIRRKASLFISFVAPMWENGRTAMWAG